MADVSSRGWSSWTEEERMRARADRRRAGERRKALRGLDAIAETIHVLDFTPRLSAFMTASSSGVAA